MIIGASVRRATDRGLRPHARGEGRREKAINPCYACFSLSDRQSFGRNPVGHMADNGSRHSTLHIRRPRHSATDMYNTTIIFVRFT